MGLAMVQSLQMRLAICAQRANRTDFLADGGKVLKGNGWKNAAGPSFERLRLFGVLCVAFLEVTQVHWCERM